MAAQIDVPATLKRVREQRMHSVQTEHQYVFIHKALLDYAILKHKQDPAQAVGFRKQYAEIQ